MRRGQAGAGSPARPVERASAVRVLPGPAEVAAEAAAEFSRRAVERVGGGSAFAVALSGGSTPLALFRLLARPPWRERVPWPFVHLFWGDERMVDPRSPASNYGTARRELIERVAIPPGNVHRVATELGLGAAERYAEELASFFGAPPGRPPRFDLVFLGLGADGHTASLFPGSPALRERERWVTATLAPTDHRRRVTLTLPAINAAAAVVFLVTGGGKAETVARALEGEEPVEVLPARGIRPVEGEVLWLLDGAAASRLDRTPADSPQGVAAP